MQATSYTPHAMLLPPRVSARVPARVPGYVPARIAHGHTIAVAGDQVLAERGTRFAAAAVDWMLTVGSVLPGVLFATTLEAAGAGLSLGIGGLLALSVYQIYLISTRGQSLGKRWLGLRIVKTDGSQAGFLHGWFLRSLVPMLIAQVPLVGAVLYYLVDPLMIFGEDRRCLHDQIAGTKVVVAVD